MWCRGKLDQLHARRHLNLDTSDVAPQPVGLQAMCAVTQAGRLLAVGSSSMVAVYELLHEAEPAHCGSASELVLHPEAPELDFKTVVAAQESGISAFRWLDTATSSGDTVSLLLVGDMDGNLRVHNQGSVIVHQRLWRSAIAGIQVCSGSDGSQPDGVLVLHADGVVCHLDGAVLFGAIQASLVGNLPQAACALQVARWSLGGNAIVGAYCGASVRTMAGPSAIESLAIVSVGSDPVLALHHASQQQVAPNTSAVASSVATQVLSSVSSWLFAPPAQTDPDPEAAGDRDEFGAVEAATTARRLWDDGRSVCCMSVDPTGKFMSTIDSLGRVMIVDMAYGTVVRMLKGYRGCLLYTSDAADEEDSVDLGGRRIIKKKKKQRRKYENL
eukprot:TRINITY_DN24691_c0_g1_i3.p1 TRINITY_DN24691_c0_g1~~TRINITY_DN24691_c0_g1_i3.p1  ORF type:complete len:386 (-),score=82.98 TRINITY_DN24691_c0_g1_i3:68-1225(-)